MTLLNIEKIEVEMPEEFIPFEIKLTPSLTEWVEKWKKVRESKLNKHNGRSI